MAKQYDNENREGFWASSDGDKQLPTPVATSWGGRTDWLRALTRAERKAHSKAYKGMSTCRVCSSVNGSEEFTLDVDGNTWKWPSGYRHYIVKHQVRPSLAFEEFIAHAGEPT